MDKMAGRSSGCWIKSLKWLMDKVIDGWSGCWMEWLIDEVVD